MSRMINPEIARSVARVRAAAQRAQAPQPYAVGGCAPRPSGLGLCGGASLDKMCFKGGKRLCDLQKVSNSVSIAGGQPWQLNLEPELSAYFEPIAVRMVVTDASNSNLNYRTFITAITINKFPQEAIDTQAPTVATTQGYWSDDYTDPDQYAIPVGWGVFGKSSLNQNLTMYGFARGYAAGVTLWITLTCYGNAIDSMPDGCKCGLPLPEGKPNGGGTGTANPYTGARPQ